MDQTIILGDVYENFGCKNKFIPINDNDAITIKFVYRDFFHMIYHNNKLESITFDNYEKAKNNPNIIRTFIREDNTFKYHNKELNSDFMLDVENNKLMVESVDFDETSVKKYNETYEKIKNETERELLEERKIKINEEIGRITDIIQHVINIKNNITIKPTHYDINGENFITKDNKTCSVNAIITKLFVNLATYEKAKKQIQDYLTINYDNIIKQKKLKKIITNTKNNNIKNNLNDKKIIEFCNHYSLSCILKNLGNYIIYLQACINNLSEPYKLHNSLGFNNTYPERVIRTSKTQGRYDDNIYILDKNIDGYYRDNKIYKLVQGFILCHSKDNDKWNIFLIANNEYNVSRKKFLKYLDYKKFIDRLDNAIYKKHNIDTELI